MKRSHTAKSKLVHPSFPAQGNIQPSFQGSQSNTPIATPESMGLQAPQMPSYDNTQMSASSEY
jgi:hypothetical protein